MASILLLVLLAQCAFMPPAQGADSRPYTELVERVGVALRVSPAVIHAVIEAESGYRVRSASDAGALGLMQLVPRWGGREAYEYLYGQDAIPTHAALMRPEVNVWLGTAYLRILAKRYFGWVEDPAVRLCAVLAAYNWGPTRVMERLLPGHRQVSLNLFMSRRQARAPQETREYVRRVLASAKANAARKIASR